MRASAQQATRTAAPLTVEQGVHIGLRSGAALTARVFRPAGAARVPAVLSFGRNSAGDARDLELRELAAAGFAVVAVAPREGDDRQTGLDGFDAIRWVSSQPWSDRRVLLEGAGEGANAAWNAALAHPPELVAMVTRAPERFLGWSDAQFASVTVPALIEAGSLGEAQGFAVGTFERYTRAAELGGARSAYLVIGSLGAFDRLDLEEQYFKWALGHGSLPPFLLDRVNYLELSDSTWHSAPSLDSIGAVFTSYPLHSNESAGLASPGFLGSRALDEEPDDTLAGGVKLYEVVLASAIEIAGFPSVTLWIGGAARAAVEVSLEEIRADGTPFLLGRSHGLALVTNAAAADPQVPIRWEFDAFAWAALRLASGSILRLTVLAPAGAVVYHDVDRYSRVLLPVMRAGSHANRGTALPGTLRSVFTGKHR